MNRNLQFLLLGGALFASSLWGQEKGAPIFSDDFDTNLTFAANWKVRDGYVKPKKQQAVIYDNGTLELRRETPNEFYAELDLSFFSGDDVGASRAGFAVDGLFFPISPKGAFFEFHGEKIPNYQTGKPVRLTLIKKLKSQSVEYRFLANGKVLKRLEIALEKVKKEPLTVCCINQSILMDNFMLCHLKEGNSSPNMVVNSSFEHLDSDGMPPYFWFRPENYNYEKKEISFERYLQNLCTIDTAEKHSGKQSLKIIYEKGMSGNCFGPWMVNLVKDLPATFSVYLKSTENDLPIELTLGGNSGGKDAKKIVHVGTEWKRYEVSIPKMPYQKNWVGVRLQFAGKYGTLYVDDMQVETGDKATPYQASDLDKLKPAFDRRKKVEKRRRIELPYLPAGTVPGIDLDAWSASALSWKSFHNKLNSAKSQTTAYLACDSDYLYLGMRVILSDPSKTTTVLKSKKDDFGIFDGKDTIELFLSPTKNDQFYQFAFSLGGAYADIGKGDIGWTTDWKHDYKINKEKKTLDYFVAIPFSAFASADFLQEWLINIARTVSETNEQAMIVKNAEGLFGKTEYWASLLLPQKVVEKHSFGVVEAKFSILNGKNSTSIRVDNNTSKELPVLVQITDFEKKNTIYQERLLFKKGTNDIVFTSKEAVPKINLIFSQQGKEIYNKNISPKKKIPATIMSRLNYYMREDKAVFRINTILPEAQKMRAELSVTGKTITTPVAPRFRMEVPLADIPNGSHEVVARFYKNKQVETEIKTLLVKRPWKEHATQINHFSRSLIVNGKPFFPFSPFWAMSRQPKQRVHALIDFFLFNGFKCLDVLSDDPNMENPKSDTKNEHIEGRFLLKYATEKKMNIMFWHTTRVRRVSETKRNQTIQLLNYPCNITYRVLDEPEIQGITSADAEKYISLMREKFPYQPTYINNTVLGIPNNFANLSGDILMADYYLPGFENNPVSEVIRYVDTVVNPAKAKGKPAFFFLVGSNTPLDYREITSKEQIAETYGAIASGCTGLSYFYGIPTNLKHWQAYKQLNNEILSLTNVICSDEETKSASISTPNIRILTKNLNGYLYLITCNISDKAVNDIEITLPAGVYGNEAEVMFENRKARIENNHLKDSYAEHSRHVYKIQVK